MRHSEAGVQDFSPVHLLYALIVQDFLNFLNVFNQKDSIYLGLFASVP